MKIIAVIVTYNRLTLLKRLLKEITAAEGLDSIIVVNNGSTDGTQEWLDTQTGIRVIHQDNVGGSGGFYTGMQQACDDGADWIWCMDDDVYPEPDCLEQLLKLANDDSIGILCPRRIQDGKVFVNECRKINLTNAFASLHGSRLEDNISEPADIEGMVFEGPLISRKVVEKAGLPNKDLFIFYDDTDYSLRTTMAGFRVVYVPQARMQKELFFSNDSWETKQAKKKWKRKYHIRNSAWFNHHYGKNFAVRHLRPLNTLLGYTASALWLCLTSKQYNLSDIRQLFRAYSDGINERLGK